MKVKFDFVHDKYVFDSKDIIQAGALAYALGTVEIQLERNSKLDCPRWFSYHMDQQSIYIFYMSYENSKHLKGRVKSVTSDNEAAISAFTTMISYEGVWGISNSSWFATKLPTLTLSFQNL